ILASLDRSPKGSIDAPIVDFLAWLNAQDPVVTTSSCSGRIAVFLGASTPSSSKGGEWLLISHEPLEDAAGAWDRISASLRGSGAGAGTLATFLLEPFLLHAECADSATAQRILEVARAAGLRESGLSLGRRRVMVQLRTLAMRLEVPLAVDGRLLVDFGYPAAGAHGQRAAGRELGARQPALGSAPPRPGSLPAAARGQGGPGGLSCPRGLARAVKLAVEGRWADKSRKMVVLAGDEPGDASSRMGIPITHAAMVSLQEIRPADGDGAGDGARPGAEELEAACAACRQPPAEGAAGGKKARAETVAADLELGMPLVAARLGAASRSIHHVSALGDLSIRRGHEFREWGPVLVLAELFRCYRKVPDRTYWDFRMAIFT
ncbi:unnamed protein product, partial [Prorocentrum cordatum]